MNLYISEPKSVMDNTVKTPPCYSRLDQRKSNPLEISAAFTAPASHQNRFNRMVRMIHLEQIKQSGNLNFSTIHTVK